MHLQLDGDATVVRIFSNLLVLGFTFFSAASYLSILKCHVET